ncbi:F-box/LRR-repeat protein 6-like [Liolophura sinensis]|uniref:F-box/LRR-repeat protein 6-like n=1 Tax=Liolophura sinensis TaxID=3198878 RepID=UPI00315938A6
MSKLEKGILGYRKDPKNQILFSFGVRPGEEWPSDDSDDSDYHPTEDSKPDTADVSAKTKPPAKKPRKGLKAKLKRGRSSVESSGSDSDSFHSDSSDTIIESTIISESTLNKNLDVTSTVVKPPPGSHVSESTKFKKTPVIGQSDITHDSLLSSSSNDNHGEASNHLCTSSAVHSQLESGFSETSSSCVESAQSSPSPLLLLKRKSKGDKSKHKKKRRSKHLGDGPVPKKKKRSKEKRTSSEDHKTKKQDSKHNKDTSVVVGKKGLSAAQVVPPEILLKIFQMVVSTEGAVPFLCRAARVCRLWYNTSCNSQLWLRVDLSYGWIKSQERYLTWLSTHRIPLCTDIQLNGWKLLTYNGIKSLAENCPKLSSINLSHCPKITSRAVQVLADNCPCLAKIDLSATSTEAVSQMSLKYLLERVGNSVTHLTLGNNTLKGFNSVLNCISTHCPNLELLDVSNVFFSSDYLSFNVEKFQQGCRKLKTLRFVNSKVRASQATQREQIESPGFPALEELSIAVNTNKNTCRLAMDGDALSRILKNSTELKTLDIRGWSFCSFRSLIHIPATSVEQLLLAQNNVHVTPDFGFELVMQKWRHSLVELDLSWNSYRDNVLDAGIELLTEFPDECRVEVLDLAGTNIECSTISTILSRCPRLRAVNLSSCRSLPRGIKREFEGKELQQLRKAVESFEKEES